MIKKSLSVLFNEVHHGKYAFEDFIGGSISENYQKFSKESSGKTKEMFIPNKRLKAFHTFLNLFLFEFLPLNERVVFSYRKGFSAYDAVLRHSKSKYFFQTDISSFFSSISRDLVKKTVLEGAHFSPVADVSENINRILDLVCVEDYLPIGFPSSAPLSNAVLYKFDNKFEQFCNSAKLRYTRYSDDIIVSSEAKENLAEVEEIVESFLHEFLSQKFNLNVGKTKRFQVGGKIKILGMMILPNGKITIDSTLKRDLEVLLYTHINNKTAFLSLVGNEEEEGLARMTGYLNYANSIDQDYLNKLRKKFGATAIDTLLHRALPKSKAKE